MLYNGHRLLLYITYMFKEMSVLLRGKINIFCLLIKSYIHFDWIVVSIVHLSCVGFEHR